MEALKLELAEKLEQKGITVAKAAEEIGFDPRLLALYFAKDCNPIPNRIMEKLNGLVSN